MRAGSIMWAIPFSNKDGMAHVIHARGFTICDRERYINPDMAQPLRSLGNRYVVKCVYCQELYEQPDDMRVTLEPNHQ